MRFADGDYVLSDCWPLGSRTAVAEVGGRNLGIFKTQDEAESFVRERMAREGFYPEVWYVDDHGGISRVTL